MKSFSKKMPSFARKERFNCKNCGTQTSENNLVRHKKRFSVGTLYCTKYPNFSTRSQADLNFHIAKKQSSSQPKTIHKCQLCHQVVAGFYSLRLHRQKVHNAQGVLESKNVDVTELVGPIDDQSLKEDLQKCKHFLVDSEMENGRHRAFNFAMEILDAHTFSQKLDTVFEKLKCAVKLNVAFAFVLKNVEDGTCRYYYAHENNTMMERSKLVATKEDLVKIKNVLNNIDMIEACTKKNEQKQSGNSRNSHMWLFLLLLYSEKFPWG